MTSKNKQGGTWHLVAMVTFLLAWFISLLIFDHKSDFFGPVFGDAPITSTDFFMVRALAVAATIATFFLGGWAIFYRWNAPEYEVKAIDYIWYCGAAVGLTLSVVDLQTRYEQEQEVVDRAAVVFAHQTMRLICGEKNLSATTTQDCRDAAALIDLEAPEILEIITNGSISEPRWSDISTIDGLKDALEENQIVDTRYIFFDALDRLTEQKPSDAFQIFNTSFLWLLIFASVLGVRLSKTWIEVKQSKEKSNKAFRQMR